MAKLITMSNTSWRQPLRDRKNDFHLWSVPRKIKELCNFEDGTKRLLQIRSKDNFETIIDYFQITSGKEISFPTELQNLIKSIAHDNSYFDIEVLDVSEKEIDISQSTTGFASIKTRIGQSKFRLLLLEYWDAKCSVTGVNLVEILKASHIKPWANSSDEERLNKFNGLLLIPTLDTLFDQGLITFLDDGKIKISKKVHTYILSLGINTDWQLSKIDKEHKNFLEYHREQIFQE